MAVGTYTHGSNQLNSRGLAQKLAIRLGKHYPQSKLVEINAHSLGSKFFGESGKLVGKLFENIASSLEEEEDTFVCVFIDEIETIAARRERALSGNEPFDAIRAVNALLTGLDKLRNYSNIVTICTSNLVTALVGAPKQPAMELTLTNGHFTQDEAFLDRVDIKQFMPHLSNRIIYGIYKDCLEELNRCGIIQGVSFDVVQANPEDPETALQYVEESMEHLTLPNFDEMLLNYQMFPGAIPKELADAADASVVGSLPPLFQDKLCHEVGILTANRDSVVALFDGSLSYHWYFIATAFGVFIFGRH